jgi:RNA polymerase sigma-70 factor (ECF subfamily)
LQWYTLKQSAIQSSIAAMPNQEEKLKLDGLKQLDPQVISLIFDRFFPIVFKYVRYRINDIAQSEDIASDVFVRLLEAVKRGKGPDSNIKAWLLGTASHAINDYHRKNYRRPTEEIPESIQDSQDTPSAASEHRERQKRIQLALSKLTPEQQHVITLRFGQELSLEETAVIMKKNVNAVKQLQLRALAALSRQMDDF